MISLGKDSWLRQFCIICFGFSVVACWLTANAFGSRPTLPFLYSLPKFMKFQCASWLRHPSQGRMRPYKAYHKWKIPTRKTRSLLQTPKRVTVYQNITCLQRHRLRTEVWEEVGMRSLFHWLALSSVASVIKVAVPALLICDIRVRIPMSLSLYKD